MRAIQDVSDTNGETAIEEALADFDSSKRDIAAANYFVDSGGLPKTPGQTRDSTQALYNISMDAVKKSMDKLTLASKYGPKLPEAILHSAGSIAQVVSASQSTASTVADKKTQKTILGMLLIDSLYFSLFSCLISFLFHSLFYISFFIYSDFSICFFNLVFYFCVLCG
jgi:hypothetical protein